MTTTENNNEPADKLEAAADLAAEIDAALAQASHEPAQAGQVAGQDELTAGDSAPGGVRG